MTAWLSEHAIELVAAVASVIAAVAGILLIRDQRKLPGPTFHLRADETAQPDWHEIHLTLGLPPDQRFFLTSISVEAPRGALLLPEEIALHHDRYGNMVPSVPLPLERASKTLRIDRWMGPTGHDRLHRTTIRHIFLHAENASSVREIALRVVFRRIAPRTKNFDAIVKASRVGARSPTVWV